MKLLGIIALIFGVAKIMASWSIKEDSFEDYFIATTKDGKDMFKYLIGLLVIDGLVELICGLFIMVV